MSRIGYKTIELPAGVEVKRDGDIVSVKGPKGELSREVSSIIEMKVEGTEVNFTRPDDNNKTRAIHGTTRANVNNMVEGVVNGFSKTLKLVGVGYRAQLQGKTLTMALGYSHPVVFETPEGLSLEVPDNTTVKISGIDKQAVGDFAAEVRAMRSPEPYKGKGVRYEDEIVRRKEGKTGK